MRWKADAVTGERGPASVSDALADATFEAGIETWTEAELDARIDGAVARLEAVPAEDLTHRLDEGERLHQILTDRMAQTGREGG